MRHSRLLQLRNFTLKNKSAIVTGAGQGMGEAFAKILALNGARVAVCDLNINSAKNVAAEIEAMGFDAAAIRMDVVDPKSILSAVRMVCRRFSSPDILVNNAGLLQPTRFTRITDLEWHRIMKVNVDGVYNCCKAVVPLMIKRRYGKIINLSSTAGKASSTFGGVHYTASKAAVLGITRHLARELAEYGINVNAICPGSIDTPMVRGLANPQILAKGIRKIPLGRLGTPEEVANLVLFLASDASSYITGASIDINGAELTI
ncbi:MAG: SDR family NAD(P)-dependent oxidoreductase [Candidatus Bathyarchaeia archaeon]